MGRQAVAEESKIWYMIGGPRRIYPPIIASTKPAALRVARKLWLEDPTVDETHKEAVRSLGQEKTIGYFWAFASPAEYGFTAEQVAAMAQSKLDNVELEFKILQGVMGSGNADQEKAPAEATR